jgi:hypothetical protein
VDEGSVMMVAISRKEGDKQGDAMMKTEVEAIVMFESSSDTVVMTDKGLGTRSAITRARMRARLKTTMMTMRARLREKQEYDQ